MSVQVLLLAVALAASPSLQKARQQYDALDYERALPLLKKAETEVRSLEERVEVQLFLGLTLGELGRMQAAEDAFNNALVLDPAANLPVKASPKIEKVFLKVRARFAGVAAEAEQKRLAEAKRQQEEEARRAEEAKRAEAERAKAASDVPRAVPAPSSPAAVAVDLKAPPEKPGRGPVPYLLFGGGLASLGGGVVMGLGSRTASDAARAQPVQVQAALLNQSAVSKARTANVLYGAGAALLIGGAITFLLFTPAE